MNDAPTIEAVAYARIVLSREVDRLKEFERQARTAGDLDQAERWRRIYAWIEWQLLGGEGCVITAFDARWLDVSFRTAHEQAATAFCTCEIYTGTERNAQGVKVCERCGRSIDPPADAIARAKRYLLDGPE